MLRSPSPKFLNFFKAALQDEALLCQLMAAVDSKDDAAIMAMAFQHDYNFSQESMPNRSLIAKHSFDPSRPILVSNGFEIIPPQDSPSLGTLKIINGTTKDAAVKLVDNSSKKTRRFVYVQANHEALLKKISPCGCSIRFTLGKNWSQGKRSFSQNPSFFKFNNRLDFRETKTAAGVQWMNYTITLHSVPTGNVKTAPISERDF